VGHIDYSLNKFSSRRLGLRYDAQGCYHSISDPTEEFEGLPKFAQHWVRQQVMKYISSQPHHRFHDPVCDATEIYASMLFVRRYLQGEYSWHDVASVAKWMALETWEMLKLKTASCRKRRT